MPSRKRGLGRSVQSPAQRLLTDVRAQRAPFILDSPLMPDFLSLLDSRVLVCDGAMGTMLYNKGIFISRSFDELNLLNPQLIRDIHTEYVNSGADIIETNTFGGNR